jgi:V-type H+-transporting ATPase proteolipid subunit
MLIRF